MREERIEAANRSECVAKCKAQGIAPISVKDGGKVSNAEVQRRGGRRVRTGLLWLAIGIVVGGGVWRWFLGRQSEVTIEQEKPKTIVRVKEVTKSVVSVSKAPQQIKEVLEVDKPPKGYIRLPMGKDIRCKLPPIGETKQLLAFGEMYEIDSAGNVKSLSPPPIFDNRFENTMMALSSEGMGMMPGAAEMIPKDEVVSFLMKPIEVKEDDNEDVIAKKIATAEMKEALKEFLKSGGTWEEFVAQARSIQQAEQMLESEARMEMAKILRDGDIELAKEYKNKVNAFMKSKGYRGLKLPSKWKELIDE